MEYLKIKVTKLTYYTIKLLSNINYIEISATQSVSLTQVKQTQYSYALSTLTR